MGFNRGGRQGNYGQQGQRELMNTPLGGERKSSMFFVSGKGKLVARGTFDVQALHQNIEVANNDPRNSKPGQISIALFETDRQEFGILVGSPVRESTGGRGHGGYQGQGGQNPQYGKPGQYGSQHEPQQQYGQPAPQAQQWGPPPVQQQQPPWVEPQQHAPASFQERYTQPQPEPEPEVQTKKRAAKKAAPARIAPAKGKFSKAGKK